MIRNEDKNQDVYLSGWEALAGAIILQACSDYRKARKKLKRNPDYKVAAATVRECERFFRSDWFGALSDVDGNDVLNKLKKESV